MSTTTNDPSSSLYASWPLRRDVLAETTSPGTQAAIVGLGVPTTGTCVGSDVLTTGIFVGLGVPATVVCVGAGRVSDTNVVQPETLPMSAVVSAVAISTTAASLTMRGAIAIRRKAPPNGVVYLSVSLSRTSAWMGSEGR